MGELLHARAAGDGAPLVRERGSSGPARHRAWSSRNAVTIPSTSSGATTLAGARLAQQLGGGAVGWHEREDRPLGREVLEHLAGQHALAAAVGLRDQEQQRLGVALELERAAARARTGSARAGRRALALGPLAVGRAEVAEEARHDVVETLRERRQERPRVALAEERARRE